jgi:uncharacterized lipoprotein YmbA
MKLAPPVSWLPYALAALTCACASSPEPRYFVLEAIRHSDRPATELSILIEPITVPGEVDRPQFVLSRQNNEVVVDELHRWAAPLQDSLADVLSSDLAAQVGSHDVATARYGGQLPQYRVSVAVQAFHSRVGEYAQLEASWYVRRDDDVIHAGRSNLREPVQGRDFGALASAHSRAVSRMSAEIAAAILALESFAR